jgi:hypothetical protein
MMAISSTLGLALLASFVLYICIGSFINYRKLSAFKGPPLAGLSRAWLWRQSVAKRVHIAQKEALAKYGMTA